MVSLGGSYARYELREGSHNQAVMGQYVRSCVYPSLSMNDQAIPRQFDETCIRKSRLDFPQIVQKQGFQLIVVNVA